MPTAYTKDSPIHGKGQLDARTVWNIIKPLVPNHLHDKTERYIGHVYFFAPQVNINPDLVIAQSWLETGHPDTGNPFQSRWWEERNNPGGLGITGDPAQNERSQTFETTAHSALAMLAHLIAYTHRYQWRAIWPETWEMPNFYDHRFSLVLQNNWARAITIQDLAGRWAANDAQYGSKIAARANRLLAGKPAAEEPNMSRILKGTEDIIVKQALSWSGPNRPGAKLAEGDIHLIEHDTGNSNRGAGPYSHETFVIRDHGGSDNVSFHTTSGIENGKRVVVQLLRFDEIGWHAADGCNDGPNVDWGCKRGLANEMCVNQDIDVWESYKLAADVAAMLIYKDSRFDWTGFGDRQLSTSRIKSHQQASAQAWGGTGKYCSNYMLRNRLFPNDFIGRVEKRLENATTTPAPTEPPLEVFAPGLDEGIATELFGSVAGYHFDKRGPISQRWLQRGLGTKQFPRLVDVLSYEDGKRRYFVFSDGWTVLVANGEFIELGGA